MKSDLVKAKILVVDDCPNTLEVLRRNLVAEGYHVTVASDVAEGLDRLSDEEFDLVITDLKMPGVSGMDLVRHVHENYRDSEVMMITGYPSIQGAITAVKRGAEEYLAKPFTDEELLSSVQRVLEKLQIRRMQQKQSALSTRMPSGLLGESDVMKAVFAAVEKASSIPATVLITGESGTGKELVARAIHYKSPRASAPFVPINCGGIPEGLLESELFGHVKGAFTGAGESRAGFFHAADGGSVLLDEISETSASMQVKLLRVLQEKEICMVGSTRPRKVDVRIMAATNKDLLPLLKSGIFREDLYYRLNVVNICIPPLRDRKKDILLLVRHFMEKFSRELGRSVPRISDEVLRAFLNYEWPGNVRELENLIQRVVLMTENECVNSADLPEFMRFSATRTTSLDRTLAEVELDYIQKVLNNVGGNKTEAARILGIDRKTLRSKLDRTRQ